MQNGLQKAKKALKAWGNRRGASLVVLAPDLPKWLASGRSAIRAGFPSRAATPGLFRAPPLPDPNEPAFLGEGACL